MEAQAVRQEESRRLWNAAARMSVSGSCISRLLTHTDRFRVCVASWIRVRYLVEAKDTTDPTWVSGETATWSSIESSLGIVSACLPVLRPLFSRVHKGLGSSIFTRSFLSAPKGTYGHSTGEAPSHARNLGSDWQGGPVRRENQRSEDAIELTNIISGGGSGDVSCADADRIMVRSEVKQAHSYV